jgi:DNA-binding NarL/FixJ family response regulator
VSPATAAILPGHLTAREATIADLLSRGLTNPMIAERLCLPTQTVANYLPGSARTHCPAALG